MSLSGTGKAWPSAARSIAAYFPPIATPFFRRQTSAAPKRKVAILAPHSDGLSIEWKSLTRLDAGDTERLRDLSARALQPNVFYEPEYLLAARSLALAEGAGVLLVGSAGRLIGALAGRIEGLAYGRPVTTFVAWELPYAPLSVPLVDREAADVAVDAFLNEMPRLPGNPRVALFRLMDREGPFARVLADRLYSRMKQPHALDPHRRAALIPGEADPLKGVSQKRLKELRRQRARLSENGALTHDTVTGEGIEAAVEAYLKLEASGWKGRIGAAASVSGAGHFLAEAVIGLAREGKARIDFLKLDGNAIAATILLFSGNRAWFWKTAYDENYARFSPGVLLALELTETLGRDRRVAFVDSCAVAGHPMIDHLWRGRIEVADRIVPLADASSATLAFAAEKFRRAALKPIKSLRDKLRG
jgi:hypothetical protein